MASAVNCMLDIVMFILYVYSSIDQSRFGSHEVRWVRRVKGWILKDEGWHDYLNAITEGGCALRARASRAEAWDVSALLNIAHCKHIRRLLSRLLQLARRLSASSLPQALQLYNSIILSIAMA